MTRARGSWASFLVNLSSNTLYRQSGVPQSRPTRLSPGDNIEMYAGVYVRVCVCVCVCVCSCMYVCMHACMYVCM